jgi:RNA polymerase sigma factor for flagellar operon FliA
MNTTIKTLPSSVYGTNLSASALRELVKKYSGLVRSVAFSISKRNTQASILSVDDLFQYGIFGLIDAIERYDAHKGAKFETFALYRIKGAILDGLRSADERSRTYRKKQREMNAGRDEYEYQSMMKLKLNVEEYQSFMQETEGAAMSTVYTDVDTNVLESIPDDEKNNPFEILNAEQTRLQLIKALEQLPERERLIVTLYYYEGLTFREVGKILRLSETRVFQIHSEAIIVLRSKLAGVESTT